MWRVRTGILYNPPCKVIHPATPFFWKLEIQYWAETSYGGEIKLGRILIHQVHQMAKTVENNHSIIFTHSILLKVIELHHHMWFLYIFTDIPELIYFAPELSSCFLEPSGLCFNLWVSTLLCQSWNCPLKNTVIWTKKCAFNTRDEVRRGG